MKQPKPGKVEVTSGYGANTRRPFIQIHLPEREPLQLEIDDARIVGQMIIEACESAEQDGFLVEWTMKEFNISIEQASGILHHYREWRDRRRAKQRTKSA